MIRTKVQTALDTVLHPNVLSYWQRKSGKDADEYIVYTLNNDSAEIYADDEVWAKSAAVTVRYYYRAEKLGTHASREAIKLRETTIETALKGAGFTIPNGKFDAGDVDDIGYFVTVFECNYWSAA